MKKGEKKNQPKPPEKRDQNEEKEKPVENAAQLSAAPLRSAQHTQPVVSRRLRSAPLRSAPLLALRCAALRRAAAPGPPLPRSLAPALAQLLCGRGAHAGPLASGGAIGCRPSCASLDTLAAPRGTDCCANSGSGCRALKGAARSTAAFPAAAARGK